MRARLPREDVVYLADQARVPYGDRTDSELRAFLVDNLAFLASHGVDAIVMGCNTSCAVAATYGWPKTSMPVFDLVTAVSEAVVKSGARRVGVIATLATAASGAYGKAIRTRGKATWIEVQEVAAPELVPLVEAGTLEGPVARAAVAEACAEFELPLDAVVLACTHYPLLDAHFAAVLGEGVSRIDPAAIQAERAADFVARRGGERGTGSTLYVTTGELEPFEASVVATCGALGPGDSVERAAVRAV